MTDPRTSGQYVPLPARRLAATAPSLDDLYRDQLEFVWRTCRYLGVKPADAEDVAHEVFIVVQRRFADYDPEQSARAWLAGITRRVVMHHHRSTFRAERKKLVELLPPDSRPAPDAAVSRHEAATLLQAFLDGLEPSKREVFVLSELEGLSAPEIARALECNLNTVYSRIRVVRQAFEKRVARLESTRRRESGG